MNIINKQTEPSLPAAIKQIEEHERVRIFRMQGELDKVSIAHTTNVMDRLINKLNLFDRNLLIDLQNVSAVDSAGVAGLLLRIEESNQHGALLGIFNQNQALINLMEVQKVLSKIQIFQSEQEAFETLNK